MKKNVLLVSHFSNLSGAPISLALLAKYLKQYDYNPYFSIPAHGQLEKLLQELDIPYVITGTVLSLIHLRKLIIEKEIQLVHANTIIAAPAAILAWFMKKKLIWHIREDISANRIMTRIIEKISDRIIILSESMRGYFNPTQVQGKLSVIHNGVDLSLYTPISVETWSRLRTELGVNYEQKIVLLIGTIEPRKGQRYFIEAIEKLKDLQQCRFFIIGNALPGQGQYKRKLEKLAQRLNLKTLTFLPARADIPSLLQVADLVCVPSLAEPFGRVVVEAMAAAKPVIGAAVGGIPEIILPEITGRLVPPTDTQALADAIRDICTDTQLAKRMGQAGYERVVDFFSIQAHVSRIVAIYNEVLN